MVLCSEEQIYEMKRGPGQDSDGVRVRLRLKIQSVETRATVLRTWGQKSVNSNQMSPDIIVVLLQSLLCVKKGWERAATQRDLALRLSGEGTPLTSSRTFMQNGKLNQVTGEVPSAHGHCDSVLAPVPVTPQ